MVYVVTFVISSLLAVPVQKYNKRDVRHFFGLMFMILIPCLVAALRAFTIGTDVKVYAEPMFNIAKQSNNFFEFLNQEWVLSYVRRKIIDTEIGYDLLVYISANTFNSMRMLLFLTEYLIIAPVYYALYKQKDKISIWLGMFVFFCMFYNGTLNIMRQGIAMSFILLGFSCLMSKEKKKALICLVVATLFHTAAVIAIVIYGIFYFSLNDDLKLFSIINKFSKTKFMSKTRKVVVILILTILLIVFFDIVISLLAQTRFYSYVRYIQNGFSFAIKPILIRMPFLLLIFMCWDSFKENDYAVFYTSLLIIDMVLSQLIATSAQTIRISMFFSYFNILAVPTIVSYLKKHRRSKLSAIVVFLWAYWMYYTVLNGSGETYPYVLGLS